MIYTVKPGDTLAEIARRFGVPLDVLVRLNEDIENVNLIYIGQQIYIPEAGEPEEREPRPAPRPIPRPEGAQYTIRRIGNLLLLSFANKSNYRQGETVVLYLVKINIGSTPLTLHYSTAQRFDFRAAANNQLWVWSNDRSFASQEADVVLRPKGCEVYTVNWNQRSNNGRQMTGNIDITSWNVGDRINNQRLSFPIAIS
ncbi:MAG: LysM peptidoglycan-binding domain-containing protein [Halanaerobium sp.]|nr:LysM peptidoglycan-binding domain-containing protein [Halanaerobium sp.]